MTIVITPLAARDISDIRRYIAVDDPATADKVARRLLQAIQLLDTRPGMGRPSKDGRRRLWSVPGLPYVIPYRVVGEKVIITRVFHTSRRRPKSLS